MTTHLWQSDWAAPLLTHLLQSTAFVVAAWLLTLVFRRYPARIRFWVWMGASLKFMVPFAVLTDLGARWAKPQPVHTALYTMIEEFSQPLGQAGPNVSGHVLSTQARQIGDWLPWILAAVWLCGFLFMLVRWLRQWRNARRMVIEASPLNEGRVLDALRHAEANAEMSKPIPIVVTQRAVEPGIFGVFHQRLLWPAGLSEHLDEKQIRAIVAHELEHVRRRDNLVSAVHSAVEALFWFHPAVYWMRAKMNDERERACDESVLAGHAQPDKYAESILKVCTFCLEAPSACVAGISGSDLKARVVRILNHRSGTSLTLGRRLCLAAVALFAIALPIGFGVVHGQANRTADSNAPDAAAHLDLPKFDVASIKPGQSGQGPSLLQFTPDGTTIKNLPLQFLLREAFGVEDDRIVGAPSWVKSNRYDIEAKVAPEDAPKLDKLKADERRAMMLPLLVERFNLKYHHETRELPMYALVVAKGGPKLAAAKPEPSDGHPQPPFDGRPPKGIDTRGRMMMSPGRIESSATTVDMLVHPLAAYLGRSVVDKTQLTGRYDYTLQWTPDNAPPPMMGGPGGPGAPAHTDSTSDVQVSLFTAIQEQLGLKLEAEKGSVDVIVIDHIDLPSAN